MQGKVDAAQAKYEEALAVDPRAAVAANNLAMIYANKGDNLDAAQQLATMAVGLTPNRPELQDTLGWVYFRRELPALAISAFRASIELDPRNPTYHYHLGLALAKNGNPDDARKAVEAALKLKPDFTDAQRLLQTLRG
jgi:Flp pilus assembly protein TadD